MNDYEVLLLLDPELPEEKGGEIVTRMREQVEGDGGSWDGHEPWGRRRLAYEIDHKAEGVYHLVLFTAGPETLGEVARVLKITDGVVRHLAVRRVQGGTTKAPAVIAVAAPAEETPSRPPAAPAAAPAVPAATPAAPTAAPAVPAAAPAAQAAAPAAEAVPPATPAAAPATAEAPADEPAVSVPADDSDGATE